MEVERPRRRGALKVRGLVADSALMAVRVWVLGCALSGLFIGVILLLGASVPEGVGALAATCFWFAGRLRIIDEPGVAGRFLRRKETIALVQGIALVFGLITVIAVALAAVFAGWGHDAEGRLLFFSLIVLELYLGKDIIERSDIIDHLRAGYEAEEAVARALSSLRDDGWEVINDWRRDDRGGNVDHAVRGPNGVFAIETKSRPYRSRDLGQAISNAVWLKQKWNARWATAVICVDDTDQLPVQKGHGRSSAWVVDRRALAEFLTGFR